MARVRKIPGVTAVGVVRRDGIVIDELFPKSTDARRVGAMAATIVGTSEMAVEELNRGTFEKSIVEAEQGKIIALGAGSEAILIALVKTETNLGLALMQMGEQAQRVGEILGALA